VSNWPATKARRVLAALQRIGWVVKRQSGSHRTLSRPDRPDFVFAFTTTRNSVRAFLPELQSTLV
jgi:predicted RNA binding protein YcfA (HicA-like mRNA interferase family)